VSRILNNVLRLADETNHASHSRWFRRVSEVASTYGCAGDDSEVADSAITHYLMGSQDPIHLKRAFGSRRVRHLAHDLAELVACAPRPASLERNSSRRPSRQLFTFIDLFAGIGGFHLALSAVGGKCVFASEIDGAARATYAMNFGILPYGDIRSFSRDPSGRPCRPERLRQLVPRADIIAAGFPCQPFSLAGVSSRKFHGLQHGLKCQTQGTLFEDILILARALKPKALLLENVRNLASHDGGKTLRVIREEIEDAGYSIFPRWNPDDKHWAIIDSNSVVGQRRKRVYLVCIRKDLVQGAHHRLKEFVFPNFPVEPGRYSLRQTIERDTMPDKQKFREFSISKKLYRSHLSRDRRHRSKNNGFETNLMRDLEVPAPTLVARYYKDGKDCLIPHPKARVAGAPPRMLTPKECALLQTFPNNFWIHPRKSVAYKQFGNAITVEVAKRISQELSKFISNT